MKFLISKKGSFPRNTEPATLTSLFSRPKDCLRDSVCFPQVTSRLNVPKNDDAVAKVIFILVCSRKWNIWFVLYQKLMINS